MSTYYVDTPFDTAPDNTSVYQIFAPDDQLIIGNGVDDIQKYDLESCRKLDGGAPKGNIFIVYKNILFVSGDPSFPHRVWASHRGNAEGWSLNISFFDVYPQDGRKINSFSIVNDELIITKGSDKTYGFKLGSDGLLPNGLLRIVEGERGQTSTRAGIVDRNKKYYLTENTLETYPATQLGGIGYIVDEVIRGIDPANKVKAAAGAINDKIYFSIGDVTVKGVDISDACLVYDVNAAAFALRDKIPALVFTRFIDTDNYEKLYFGTANGKVFKFDDDIDKTDQTYPQMIIETKPYLEEIDGNKQISKIGVFCKEPNGLNVHIKTSPENDFRNIGSVHKEISWLPYKGDEAPYCKLRFTHVGRGRPELYGWAIHYKSVGKRQND